MMYNWFLIGELAIAGGDKSNSISLVADQMLIVHKNKLINHQFPNQSMIR